MKKNFSQIHAKNTKRIVKNGKIYRNLSKTHKNGRFPAFLHVDFFDVDFLGGHHPFGQPDRETFDNNYMDVQKIIGM